MRKVVDRKIVVKGDKGSCGHCAEADSFFKSRKNVNYKYEKRPDLEEMPVIEDCKTYSDGRKTCRRYVGFSRDDFKDLSS